MDSITLRERALSLEDPAVSLSPTTGASGPEEQVLRAVAEGDGLTRAELARTTGLPDRASAP